MLRYSKFLLRRLACVPWLLAVGLVLGGAEEAVAQQTYVTNANANEGSDVVFTVRMTQTSAQDVLVNYTVTVEDDDTATLGTDFTAVPGVLTIATGNALGTITVSTTQDVLYEANETFTLTLLSVSSGTILLAKAKGFIDNEDVAPAVTVAPATASEGDGTMNFAVTLTSASGLPAEVTYETSVEDANTAAQADFVATEGTLTIAAGATTGTISVPIIDDTADEPDEETFTLTLSEPDNATLAAETITAQGTINDNDNPPLVNVDHARATEGTVMHFTVRLSAASGQNVEVTYGTNDGTATVAGNDFKATTGTLTIAAGATTRTIYVPIINEGTTEHDEIFTLVLSNPQNATLGTVAATGTIISQFPSVSVEDARGVEGSPVVFPVTLSAASTQTVEVTYATTPVTATSGTDFTAIASGVLTFATGEMSKTVSVGTIDDSVDEQDETFTLVLLNASAGVTLATATATGTIEDNDDPLSLSVDAASGVEGSPVVFTVTLSRAVSTETVEVAYATTPVTATLGTDFTAASGVLTFATGEMSKMVSVGTIDDSVDELNETFTLVLLNASAGVTLATPTATGTITDNDGSPSLSVATASGVEGSPVDFTVTLSPVSGQEVTVTYATSVENTDTASAADFTAAAGTLTFTAGEMSKTVSVVTLDDSIDEPDETFTLTLSSPSGATLSPTDATTTGTIRDDEASPSLSVAAASSVEGSPVVFAVTLSPVSGQEVTVTYATSVENTDTASGTDFTAVAGVLTFAAGEMSKTVSVGTTDDSFNEQKETFTLTLSSPSAGVTLATATATGTIEDNDELLEGAITLTVNPSSVREDAGTTDITVKAKKPNTVTVDTYVTLNLAAESVAGLNSRFLITLPTLRIPKGEKEAVGTISFTPIDDAVENNDLPITIEGRAGAGSVGNTTIELVDDDKPSTQINLSFSDASIGKSDGTTDIVVTATLNGDTLGEDLRFALTVDEDFAGSAERDVDYTATMAPITIPDRRISGRATITIRPKNAGTGVIRVVASKNPQVEDGRTVVVNGASIDLTGDPAKAITGLTATPFSIREDAGPKVITLEVTLQNALVTDEIVQFTISDDSDIPGDDFRGAVAATRDVDYSVIVEPLIIPKGETKGTTTMTVTPRNNNNKDDPRAFMVNARVGNNPLFSTGILITDDDTTSDSITLEVSPTQITEGAGPTAVTVTGTLQGKVFGDNVVVNLVISDDINNDGKVDENDKAATRDLDYTAVLSPLVIPGGATQGTTTLSITPLADSRTEGDEKIGLRSLGNPRAIDEDGDIQELIVSPVAITLKDSSAAGVPPEPQDPTRPTFAAADTIANQSYMVGTAIDALVLPEARGGTAPLTYSVSTLPAGLAFDAATRTLSGMPTAATDGAVTIIYTVIDSDRNASALIFSITVEEGEMPPPVADAQLTATPSAIREDAATTQIALTVSLASAKAATETVTFTVVAPSEGKPAVRDVDYVASLGAIVTIPAGATVGTTILTFTPINNTAVDSLRAIGVQATFASGAMLMTDIKIVDDETPSTAISLSVNPHAIVEGSGEANITVTATLNGKVLGENATVVIAIDTGSTATRDVDYAALFNPLIVIPAGSITGSTQFAIRIIDDDLVEGNETIKLIGVVNGLAGDEAEITLSDQAPMTPDPGDPSDPGDSSLAFAANTAIPDQSYTAGTAITPLVLPAASGGTAPLVYSVSALPAGLAFDAATRTISGTPTAATDGAVIVIYTVIDSGGSAAVLTFNITVNAELVIGDLFDLFGSSGKIVPTASHDGLAEIREFVVGQRVEGLVLPAASGGTAPLTYSLSPALPAGLTFDVATRTIAGTPRAAAETVYTYTVTDANGATASLSLQTRPTAFSLADNFPNPFNPATTIQYALPQAADVELTVYNVVGQPVRRLVAEHQSAGRYAVEWDATNDSGHSLSSGMYFYRLQAGEEFREVKKMLLLK
ncbi:MAG: putative Ig domain-containing protein [Gemmatimonadetes bacterium]|nr:putative Ig domain-containing protein [Gemmatimonadota bacterium]